MKKSLLSILVLISSLTSLVACQQNSADNLDTNLDTTKKQLVPIKINQVGYQIDASKVAIVPKVKSTEFSLIEISSNNVVYRGKLSPTKSWQLAGASEFSHADFSIVNDSGFTWIRFDTRGMETTTSSNGCEARPCIVNV